MGSSAAACRELAARARFGALATMQSASGVAGTGTLDLWPFATLVAVAADDRGCPLLFLSGLAEHTKNLERCPRASLLLVDPAADVDPLAGGRMTLVGECARVVARDRDAGRSAFLVAHPESAETMGFADFALWRMAVTQIRWVGGFGRMGWVDAGDYVAWSAGPHGT